MFQSQITVIVNFFPPGFTGYIFLYDRKILSYTLHSFIAKNDKIDVLLSILTMELKQS